jgi:hypothetical protein
MQGLSTYIWILLVFAIIMVLPEEYHYTKKETRKDSIQRTAATELISCPHEETFVYVVSIPEGTYHDAFIIGYCEALKKLNKGKSK